MLMKKFFTLIAAAMMAVGAYAGGAKEFTADTYLQTNSTDVATWVDEGWAKAGSPISAAANKKGSIDPQTGEDKGQNGYKVDGITLKKGNVGKIFKMNITGATSIEAYGVTGSSSETRKLVVTATPDEGDAITGSADSEPGYTAVVKITNLDKNKTYDIEITGTKSDDDTAGADVALHGIWVKTGTATGISSVEAEGTAVSADAPTYNLSGQKVDSSYKGIVVKDGKKYINK